MAKILLVDDDVDLVNMNRAVLERRGHQVIGAYSASEAREALGKGRPDIAVLDVMMESTSAGFELAREVHRTFADLPMIILSGIHEATGLPFRFSPDDDWLPVLKFLDKPVEPSELAGEIEAILKAKK
jgi:two-component system alkaline phosphatase synthesis response regulator PhoP